MISLFASTGCGQGPIFANGTINVPVLRYISRTYAQAVAGDINTMRFNMTTGEFVLVYTPKSSCTLPTEIYLNEGLFYPNGFVNTWYMMSSSYHSLHKRYSVTVLPPRAATWQSLTTNYISVVAKSFTHDITIIINPLK